MFMTDSKLSGNTGVIAALLLWFYLAASLAAQGALIGNPGKPPIVMGLAVTVPVLLMTIAYSRKQWLWSFANSLELRLLVLLNVGRLLAIDFLINYSHGNLPAGFALPAGIGDILTAIFSIALASSLQAPSAQTYRWFIRWNIFGLLDLIVAVAAGIVYSGSIPGFLADEQATTGIMTMLPHSLVPTFFVPLYISLHLLMLYRARKELSLYKTAI
jgi:hypothetical protein